MIKALANINAINRIMRDTIIAQTELSPEMVLNGLSLYGTDLDKLFEGVTYESIEHDDVLCVFELAGQPMNGNNVGTRNRKTNEIIYYRAFSFRITLYGNNSSEIATRLVSRLRSREVRSALYDSGVYLDSVDNPDVLNEYKNNSMWLRSDINVNIACKLVVPSVHEEDWDYLSELRIIKEIKTALVCSPGTICGRHTVKSSV